jgi:hypothetical protein
MRGYPEYNFPAFHAMAKRLRDNGHTVYSPAENDEADDAETTKITEEEATNRMPQYMRRDLLAVLEMGAVAVLPGWEKSSGAKLEVGTALTCNLPVYDAESLTNGGSGRRIIGRVVIVEVA